MYRLKIVEVAGRTTTIRSMVTGGQAIEALVMEVHWKMPAGRTSLKKTLTVSAPTLNLMPPVALSLRQGGGAEADDGRLVTMFSKQWERGQGTRNDS
jgi:hypothetical protein